MQDWHHTRLWQTGLELVTEIYAITRMFPPEERYAMTSQLRRAATSILANFAEGFCRISPADKQHKYIIARGECAEVCAFLDMAISVGLATQQQTLRAKSLIDGVGKMLSGFVYSTESLNRSA
ncbi:MAG TPA: diversity-generating retroelement protein bAvd family protein [Candidatus Peribacter riflensis]|nr:diversity-generating retroelement protein bAvd family protein [Candidatus Peribacter riflensis]HBU09482.1 diversity-generating retroelement protein bAvd family protein [Candidatus Peribacter riflensis]